MRILFLSNLYPPNEVGGYERLCHQVATALAGRGHEAHVLTSTFGAKDQDKQYPGVAVTRKLRLLADSRDIYRPFEATQSEREQINQQNVEELRRAVGRVQPDLIFAWNLYFFDATLMHCLSEVGVPTAFFLTDNWMIAARTPERIHAHFEQHVRGNVRFIGEDRLADQASPHTAIYGSHFVRQLYTSCGYRFAREMVVHNGVSPPYQDTALTPDRKRLQKDDELRLLFGGRLVDIKGPQDCVAALPQIQAALGSSVRAKLTLVGDASDTAFKAKLDEQVRNSPCRDAITFIDTVSEGELIDLFNTSDLYLFPSHYEPFALTLILAMAAGAPTVASNVGGNGEIVLHNRTGLLYDKGNIGALTAAVMRMFDEPELRASLAARGRRFARRFTFERMIAQLSVALEDLAEARSRRPLEVAR